MDNWSANNQEPAVLDAKQVDKESNIAEEGPRTETFYKKACYILQQYAQYRPNPNNRDVVMKLYSVINKEEVYTFHLQTPLPCSFTLLVWPQKYTYM